MGRACVEHAGPYADIHCNARSVRVPTSAAMPAPVVATTLVVLLMWSASTFLPQMSAINDATLGKL